MSFLKKNHTIVVPESFNFPVADFFQLVYEVKRLIPDFQGESDVAFFEGIKTVHDDIPLSTVNVYLRKAGHDTFEFLEFSEHLNWQIIPSHNFFYKLVQVLIGFICVYLTPQRREYVAPVPDSCSNIKKEHTRPHKLLSLLNKFFFVHKFQFCSAKSELVHHPIFHRHFYFFDVGIPRQSKPRKYCSPYFVIDCPHFCHFSQKLSPSSFLTSVQMCVRDERGHMRHRLFSAALRGARDNNQFFPLIPLGREIRLFPSRFQKNRLRRPGTRKVETRRTPLFQRNAGSR